MEGNRDPSDVVYALTALLAVLVVPTLVRIRLVYTFLWTAFAGMAIMMESPTALGLATAMGLSVMLSWYMLRFFDRFVFDSVLLGWFGFLSKYRVFCWLANTGDFLLHFVSPLALAANYLKHVEVLGAMGAPGSRRLAGRKSRVSLCTSAPSAVLGRSKRHHAGRELDVNRLQVHSTMDSVDLFEVAHNALTRTVLKVRGTEDRMQTTLNADSAQAVILLFSMALLPVFLRVRILYTFCWGGFTVLAHVTESQAALGMATSLGLTIMMGWYSLRAIDRTTFMGILQGWFGFLSKYRPFRLLANSVDLILHMVVPLMLAFCYMPLVRLWMTIPILLYVCLVGFSQLWIWLVVGGDLYPAGNQVYHFYPPRPKAFWQTARKVELFYNITIPLGCVIIYEAGLHELIVNRFLWSNV
ncbi:hypothetical protein G195_007565 [Phytophthora kernoviae 00238/432]|uniref:Uncharacterized protein n=1 Tax=Phytophthora kernoviae 00238/432 TaxID=1284355 RepID=A0A8J4S9Z7_9STRA|nr:hypothetical protein G195_007565 [Phytophthora kernoviae 00238/432]